MSQSERERAIQEAHRNESVEKYFKARPQLDFTHNRSLFEKGFDAAWQVALNNQVQQEPVEAAEESKTIMTELNDAEFIAKIRSYELDNRSESRLALTKKEIQRLCDIAESKLPITHIKIPTDTMEQEFSTHQRIGYKKGYDAAKEQARGNHYLLHPSCLRKKDSSNEARPILITRCPRCNGEMKPGIAMGQTLHGMPDFIGSKDVVTVSLGGPGKLIDCMKCVNCGYSVTANSLE